VSAASVVFIRKQSLTLSFIRINFAVYGDPSPANSPVNLTSWPQYGYSSGSKNLLDFSTGNISVITDDYREQQIAFFSSNPTQFNLRRGVGSS
jgi:hypothetical protein